ncbi:restriction endonuclease subunit S [Vibrio fluvialis]
MAGRYKAYPEYKDSPIDWLDEIPTHWTTKKLKHLGEAIIGLTYSPDEVVDASDPDATLVLRSSNVQNQKITLNDNVFVNKQIPKKLSTRLNDILICSRNGSRALIGKNALIDKDSVGMSFGAFMTIYRSKYNTYLSHVMNSKLFEYQSGSFLTSTINQLTTGNLNSFEIPFPSESERVKIANFLDHEAAKIDILITKQEKLIELLKEKRQAVISHAVTKGLNPDAPMKDSGVEWLGEVPEHWTIGALQHFLKAIGDVDHYMPPSVDSGIPYVMTGDLTEQVSKINFDDCKQVSIPDYQKLSKRIKTSQGDIIMARYATIGSVSYVDISKDFLVSYSCVTIKPDTNKFLGLYLFYFFKSQAFLQGIQSHINTNTQGNVGVSDLKTVKVTQPNLAEQKAIVDYLEAKLSKIDALTEKATAAIQLMKERKTALISAAVTGKIDVRDWEGDR